MDGVRERRTEKTSVILTIAPANDEIFRKHYSACFPNGAFCRLTNRSTFIAVVDQASPACRFSWLGFAANLQDRSFITFDDSC